MRILLVGGARIQRQNAVQGLAVLGRNPFQQMIWEDNIQRRFRRGAGEAAIGVGMTIGIGNIWFDVKNGCPVQQVCAGDMKDRPHFRVQLDGVQAYGG